VVRALEPVSPDPGPSCPDWMDDPDDPDDPAIRAADTDPGDLDLEDPDDDPPPDVDEGELAAEAAEMIAAQGRAAAVMARLGLTAAMAADAAAALGRRGPGMPGSAQTFPGVYASRSSGFASGKPLDTAPGCLVLGQFAEEAAGPDDRYPGASDDELAGAIGAWDRVEAYASSRKHAAAAELIRRRPAEGCVICGERPTPLAAHAVNWHTGQWPATLRLCWRRDVHWGGCRIRTTALTGKASSYLPWRVLAGGHNRMRAKRAMHGRARLIPRSLSVTSSTSARVLCRKSSHC
jgi:hypothetical protein